MSSHSGPRPSTAHAVSPDSGQHWTEPGAWPVADGIHRIPLPLPMDGLRAVNVYAIETEQGLTLIDGGWAIEESRTLLDKALRDLGFSVSDITRFLVTHVHRDHYTQAVTIRSEVGSHVSLGIGDKPTLDVIHGGREEDPHIAILHRAGAHDIARTWGDFTARSTPDLSLWGYPDTWLEDDHAIEVGTRILDAVHTPGHTQGHYVFADRAAGLLFAGDHVLPTITPSIGFEPVLSENPLGAFLRSLAVVRARPGMWKARFSLLPVHATSADQYNLQGAEFKEWNGKSEWVERTERADAWFAEHGADIEEKKRDYLVKWDRMEPNDKAELILNPEDGMAAQ